MCCGWVPELGAIQLVSASLGFLVGASGGALEVVPLTACGVVLGMSSQECRASGR